VVNIDLPADELIARLKEGKIYKTDKINHALNNFFKSENILQLREMALREVASAVERKVESEITRPNTVQERFLGCISSNEISAKNVIRKTARLANYYHCKWFILYVETASESSTKISLEKQRHLINHFQMATELGAEIIKIKAEKIDTAILEQAQKNSITTICVGKPHLNFFQKISARSFFFGLIKKMMDTQMDLVILN
jgi:two-component system sensor histidine kinase KdpD